MDVMSRRELGAMVLAAWLVDGTIIADRRFSGFALLMALAASGVVTNFVFRASLAPGGPVQHLELVRARAAGLDDEAIDALFRAAFRNASAVAS